jgi:hypothetical protein
MNKSAELLQGTLDMLILKAVSLSGLHGYGVLLRFRQLTAGRRRLKAEAASWSQFSALVARVLGAVPEES